MFLRILILTSLLAPAAMATDHERLQQPIESFDRAHDASSCPKFSGLFEFSADDGDAAVEVKSDGGVLTTTYMEDKTRRSPLQTNTTALDGIKRLNGQKGSHGPIAKTGLCYDGKLAINTHMGKNLWTILTIEVDASGDLVQTRYMAMSPKADARTIKLQTLQKRLKDSEEK